MRTGHGIGWREWRLGRYVVMCKSTAGRVRWSYGDEDGFIDFMRDRDEIRDMFRDYL